MSAWIPEKVHIDLMVDYACGLGASDERVRWWRDSIDVRAVQTFEEWRRGEASQAEADSVGQMLVDEVVRSVMYRYPDVMRPVDLPGSGDWVGEPYRLKHHGYTLASTELLHAVSCYEYQACEHDGWLESEAFRFCHALRLKACSKLSTGPWGWAIEDVEQAKKAGGPGIVGIPLTSLIPKS